MQAPVMFSNRSAYLVILVTARQLRFFNLRAEIKHKKKCQYKTTSCIKKDGKCRASGYTLGSCVTFVLHTAGISNIKYILCDR